MEESKIISSLNANKNKKIGIGRITHTRNISQYTKNGEYIATYISLSDACTATGTDVASISKCCLGERASAGGYVWKYVEEIKEVSNEELREALGLISTAMSILNNYTPEDNDVEMFYLRMKLFDNCYGVKDALDKMITALDKKEDKDNGTV